MSTVGSQQRDSSPNCVPAAPQASWLAAAFSFAPIALLAEFLLKKTHHRPLGAATFALAAIFIWMLSELLARRAFNPNVSVRRGKARKIAWAFSLALSSLLVIRALFLR